jgi:hypothetical protein
MWQEGTTQTTHSGKTAGGNSASDELIILERT